MLFTKEGFFIDEVGFNNEGYKEGDDEVLTIEDLRAEITTIPAEVIPP